MEHPETVVVRRSAELVYGPREHFEGKVAIVFDLGADSAFEIDPSDTVHLVSFSDGAHTRLHRHSSRQILIFAAGEGFLEEVETVADEGSDAEPDSSAGEGVAGLVSASGIPRRWELAAGDIAICRAGIPHRHGARPGRDCTHIAIQSGEAEWLE